MSPPHRERTLPWSAVVVASDRSFQHLTYALCSMCHNDTGILGVFESKGALHFFSAWLERPGSWKVSGIKANQSLRLSVSCFPDSKNEIHGPLRVSFLNFIFINVLGYLRRKGRQCSGRVGGSSMHSFPLLWS